MKNKQKFKMGSLFRSEQMVLCQLFIQNEAAYNCVSQLGELGLVQFRDINSSVSAFQRRFVNEVRRCDEMQRKLCFIERELKKDEIRISSETSNPLAPYPKELIDLEATFEKLEIDLREVNTNAQALKQSSLELTEIKHILLKARTFFDDVEHVAHMDGGMDTDLIRHEVSSVPTQFSFVAGVIARERMPSFERMLWRVCRGNVFIRRSDTDIEVQDPSSGDTVSKVVFMLFFQGEQLKTRVKKICEGFRATLYPCPETPEERESTLRDVCVRLEDLSDVLNKSQEHRHRLLVSTAMNIESWMIKVGKVKAIYHVLNMFNQDVTRECLIAECWCSAKDLTGVQQVLRQATEESGSSVPCILNCMQTNESPPTYNRVNKFTRGFQNIVDAYGVATYGEVNPAPYTIITFPFLFAVMFGDCGHGLLIAIFALWMVLCERKLLAEKSDNEIWNTMFSGRYIILLMGLFSMYTGLIYNDAYSKSINIFGSAWIVPDSVKIFNNTATTIQLNPNGSFPGAPYPFGIDPVWQNALNKILFLNSYKMKVSVIFGVSQMVFGVILSFSNHVYFRKPLNILCEFIPQMLFLLAIFGYLVFMIFYKWVHFTYAESSCAPSLLISLINMFLFKYVDEPCYLAPMYHGQETVQTVLVVFAFICIPWMLLIKPVFLYIVERNNYQVNSSQDDEQRGFGDLLINQTIHTIEYCLGSISHTASYLRLWALSLAHAQLSEVLWNMVMKIAIGSTNYFGVVVVYIIFIGWAGLTVGVLLIMEGLSAFLHALRLHWVEFQSKFYGGLGYAFVPFSFTTVLENE